MIYDVRQTTACVYASPVAQAHHVLRLTPINRSGQRVHVAALQMNQGAFAHTPIPDEPAAELLDRL